MLATYLMAIDTPDSRNKFESLYAQYERLLFHVAFDMLKDHHLAEDAVNDAFIKIIENLDKVDKIDSLQTKRFVVIITKNICLNIIKKKSRRSENVIDALENQAVFDDVDSVKSAQSEFFQLFEMDRLKEAFSALQLDYQVVLYHHAVLGESVNRIAELLDIKPETVKKRIYRARKTLKDMLEDYER